jgi:membrane protein YdbS with pleckstrin-like domain
MEESLYMFSLPNKEYIDLADDIARMVIIQVAIQFLYYLNNSDQVQFFSADFILLVVYMVLGIMLYRLVFRKMITFK